MLNTMNLSDYGINVKTIAVNSLGQTVVDVRIKPVRGRIIVRDAGQGICVLTENGSVGCARSVIDMWTNIGEKLNRWFPPCSSGSEKSI